MTRPGSFRAVVLCALAGCARHAAAGDAGAALASTEGGDAYASSMSEREAAQWDAARGGEAEELMRLADLVGCDGLEERAGMADLRATAIAAMRYCPDFSELPFLARVAAEGNALEARAALEAVVEQAARPRRSTDPEDAEELHAGCEALLALARDPRRPRDRRVLAVGGLRMLSERGCVRAGDVPVDLDAR